MARSLHWAERAAVRGSNAPLRLHMPRETGWNCSISPEISRWRLSWRSAGAALHAGPHFTVGVSGEGALSGQRGQPGNPELQALLLLSMLLRHRMHRWAACSRRRCGPHITPAILHARQQFSGVSRQRAPVYPQTCWEQPTQLRWLCTGLRRQPPAAAQICVGGDKASSTGSCCPGSTLEKA